MTRDPVLAPAEQSETRERAAAVRTARAAPSRSGDLFAIAPVVRVEPSTVGKRGERTRDAVLSAARTLFLERGYRGASIVAVAELAQVSRASVYTYFPSKRDLLLTLALEGTRRYQRIVHNFATIPVDAERAVLVKWVEDFIHHLDTEHTMFAVWDEAAAGDEALRLEGLRHHVRSWRSFGKHVAAIGGRASGSTSASQIADGIAVLAMIERLRFYCSVIGAPIERAEVVDACVRVIEGLAHGPAVGR
ncbi:MAG TPA: TetR/AcrR family transcriptional regulator [Acidimicrobiales bacterium]|nr:TetR/AcrR family transcriptional regulator [Acidimicrobiales bacterium]